MMKLFICYTPLQVLIAQKVIEHSGIDLFGFIFFYEDESSKYNHYFHLLEREARYAKKIRRTKNVLFDFMSIYRICRELKRYFPLAGKEIYTGNLKAVHTRLLMYLLDYASFYTFDDGCGNIMNEGYFDSNKEKFLYKTFFGLMRPALVYKSLRENMVAHYSIFNEKNIYPRAEYIGALKKGGHRESVPSNKMSILLTSVLCEDRLMSAKDEDRIYQFLIDTFGITHLIPHPRSRMIKTCDRVRVIETDLIAEDIIDKLSESYEVTVVGLFSATLLNLAAMNGIDRLISIDYPNSNVAKELIDVFMKHKIKCYRYTGKDLVALCDSDN